MNNEATCREILERLERAGVPLGEVGVGCAVMLSDGFMMVTVTPDGVQMRHIIGPAVPMMDLKITPPTCNCEGGEVKADIELEDQDEQA